MMSISVDLVNGEIPFELVWMGGGKMLYVSTVNGQEIKICLTMNSEGKFSDVTATLSPAMEIS